MNKCFKILSIFLIVCFFIIYSSNIFASDNRISFDYHSVFYPDTLNEITYDIPAFPTSFTYNDLNYSYKDYILCYDFYSKFYLICLYEDSFNQIITGGVQNGVNDCYGIKISGIDGQLFYFINGNSNETQDFQFDVYQFDSEDSSSGWTLYSERQNSSSFRIVYHINQGDNLCVFFYYYILYAPNDFSFYFRNMDSNYNYDSVYTIVNYVTPSGYTYVVESDVSDSDIGNTLNTISETTNNIYDLAVVFNKIIIAFVIFIFSYTLYKILKSTYRK